MHAADTPTPTPPVVPPLDELLHGAVVVRLPMRVRFRGIDEREAVLLHGPAGWAEFAPFAEYDDAESAAWLAAAVDSGWSEPPPPLRDAVPVNATVPAVRPEEVAGVLARFPECTTAKVKVAAGGRLTDDVARVAQVRRLLGPTGRIRVDANGGWDVEAALEALTALAVHDLEYAEQPCRTVPELADLRSRLARAGVGVRIAADESIRRAEDPFAVARAGAADVAVLKVAPLGGVHRLLAVAEVLERRHGLPVVVSSALDTAVGIAAGVAAAAALPRLELACGLGTGALLADDVADLAVRDGSLPVQPVEPDPERLARLAADPATRDRWLDRAARCHRLLRTEESGA